jgi:endonuclease V-like protein UPF0215 family
VASSSSPSIIGVEDGSFKAFQRRDAQRCPLCVVKMAGPRIEEIQVCLIDVDGHDVTSQLSRTLENMAFEPIILGGITFAGFNIVDAQELFEESSRPVIIFMRDRPNNVAVKEALQKHFDDWRERWRLIEALGATYSAYTYPGELPIYFEVVGAEPSWAEKILQQSATLCRIPEPVRVARLVARGVSLTSD